MKENIGWRGHLARGGNAFSARGTRRGRDARAIFFGAVAVAGLSGCVSVPLTHPTQSNLIEHQIDRIEEISPVPVRREKHADEYEIRQTSSRTLLTNQPGGGGTAGGPAAGGGKAAPQEKPRNSRLLNNPLTNKLPDSPNWEAIVKAIGPSSKSAARKTVHVASGAYSRSRGMITGAARYAGTRLGYSRPAAPSGEYMVCARPGQVGRGGLCWPAIGKVSRGFNLAINHKGIDVCAPTGTPVYAARGGRVVYSGNKLSGFGNVVILDHGAGFCTVYAHNSRNLVRDGAYVRQGQQIAQVGQTGDASTPHCHFEMRYNTQPIDPRPYLP